MSRAESVERCVYCTLYEVHLLISQSGGQANGGPTIICINSIVWYAHRFGCRYLVPEFTLDVCNSMLRLSLPLLLLLSLSTNENTSGGKNIVIYIRAVKTACSWNVLETSSLPSPPPSDSLGSIYSVASRICQTHQPAPTKETCLLFRNVCFPCARLYCRFVCRRHRRRPKALYTNSRKARTHTKKTPATNVERKRSASYE